LKGKQPFIKISIFTIASSVLLFAGSAFGQTQKGDWEVSVLGSVNSGWVTSGGISTSSLQIYTGGAGLGYFLTDHWELEGNAIIMEPWAEAPT
jgi:hypothetical protein